MNNRSTHYFIYPKNEKNKHSGHTICVMVNEGLVFHGTAYCSPKDQFSKKEGRRIAHERALDSLKRFKAKKEKA